MTVSVVTSTPITVNRRGSEVEGSRDRTTTSPCPRAGPPRPCPAVRLVRPRHGSHAFARPRLDPVPPRAIACRAVQSAPPRPTAGTGGAGRRGAPRLSPGAAVAGRAPRPDPAPGPVLLAPPRRRTAPPRPTRRPAPPPRPARHRAEHPATPATDPSTMHTDPSTDVRLPIPPRPPHAGAAPLAARRPLPPSAVAGSVCQRDVRISPSQLYLLATRLPFGLSVPYATPQQLIDRPRPFRSPSP